MQFYKGFAGDGVKKTIKKESESVLLLIVNSLGMLTPGSAKSKQVMQRVM